MVIETAADVAAEIVADLRVMGLEVHSDAQVAEEMKDSAYAKGAAPGWDAGHYFIGVVLPDGSGVSISVSVTE